jgi:hypothetical protein
MRKKGKLTSIIDVNDIESFGKIMMKLPFCHRQMLLAILIMSSKIQDYVDVNMMSPEALAPVFAPICTGFEKKIQTFHFTKQSPTNKDIHEQIATNKQWTRIWEHLIKERALLIDMLHRQQFLEKESMFYSRSVPSPFSVTGSTPLPEDIFMAQFSPMDTIEIAKPNKNRLKKTPNSGHLFIKSDTIKRMFTASSLRL